MRTDTKNLVSITDANKRGLSSLVAAAEAGRPQVILRNSAPAAVLVGMEAMERLDHLDEIEDDLRLWGLALVRTITDAGERYDLDEVAAEFGIDLEADGSGSEG